MGRPTCILLLLAMFTIAACEPVYAASVVPALTETFGNEGGLTRDDGGWTNFGISQNGSGMTESQIKALNLESAADWYNRNVWTPLGLDKEPSQIIANQVFEEAVNGGTGTGARQYQTAINLSNESNADIPVDGTIGPGTWAARSKANSIELYCNMIILWGTRYQVLVKQNPAKYQRYFKGWLYRLKGNVIKAVHEYEEARK